jgi:hypothetical protein
MKNRFLGFGGFCYKPPELTVDRHIMLKRLHYFIELSLSQWNEKTNNSIIKQALDAYSNLYWVPVPLIAFTEQIVILQRTATIAQVQ